LVANSRQSRFTRAIGSAPATGLTRHTDPGEKAIAFESHGSDRRAASANRDHVYAGVRDEQIAALAAEIAKAVNCNMPVQLNRTAILARSVPPPSRPSTRDDQAAARCRRRRGRANHAAAVAGPTKEERFIADAQVSGDRTRVAPAKARENHSARSRRRHRQRGCR
jgi:hypothetical protein